MDTQQLLASLGGTVAIVGAFGYVFKISFEKVLESKLKAYEDRRRMLLEEDTKRWAELFDRRRAMFAKLTTLIYRVRIAAKAAIKEVERSRRADETTQFPTFEFANDEPISELERYTRGIESILFDDRAYFPRQVFRIVHDLKHVLNGLVAHVESRKLGERRRHTKGEVETMLTLIDDAYERMAKIVETFLADGIVPVTSVKEERSTDI